MQLAAGRGRGSSSDEGRDGDGHGAVLDAVELLVHALLVRQGVRHHARLQRQFGPQVGALLGAFQRHGEVAHVRHQQRVQVERVEGGGGDGFGRGVGGGSVGARGGAAGAGGGGSGAAAAAGSEGREAMPEMRGRRRARCIGRRGAAGCAGTHVGCRRRHGEDRLCGASVAAHAHCVARQMLAVVCSPSHYPPAQWHYHYVPITHFPIPALVIPYASLQIQHV